MKGHEFTWRNPAATPYGNPDDWFSIPCSSSRPNSKCVRPRANDSLQRNVRWQTDSQLRLPETLFQQQEKTRQVQGNTPPSNSAVISFQAEPDWSSPETLDDGSWNTSNHRQTRVSMSDLSDATSSSWSDVSSPRSISEDLQGLIIGDHSSPKLIPLPAARLGISCWEPVLGDVQRDHDTLVVSITSQEPKEQCLTIQRLSLEPSCVLSARIGEHERLDPRKYLLIICIPSAIG